MVLLHQCKSKLLAASVAAHSVFNLNSSTFCIPVVIFFISSVSMTVRLRETRSNLETLHEMVKFTGKVDVCKQGLSSVANQIETVDSKELLPGDIIQIPIEGLTMSCDAVLLVGGAVVNESMLTGSCLYARMYVCLYVCMYVCMYAYVCIHMYVCMHSLIHSSTHSLEFTFSTGESVPVTKVALPAASDFGDQVVFDAEAHKSHILFCGTQVIQTRAAIVRAMVIRSGFQTAKGELVRSIMFPKPAQYVCLLLHLWQYAFVWIHVMLDCLSHHTISHHLACIASASMLTRTSL